MVNIINIIKKIIKKLLPTHVKTPTILQMEAAECGAASLGIILAYFYRFVPLEELRIACGVSRDGSNASNLLLAAQRYGLVPEAFSADIEALKTFPLPAILFWEFNHFVVIERFGRNKIYINDPASGRRAVSFEEFNRAYTGVVFTFKPGKDFKPGGRRSNLLQSLSQRFLSSGSVLFYVFLASFALVIPGLIIPAFSQIFIDEILVNHFHNWLPPLLIGLAMATFLRAAFSWLQQKYLLRLEIKLFFISSAKFVWHVLRLPMTFFTQRFTGDIISRISANDRLVELVAGEFSRSLADSVFLIFYVIVMLFYDRLLTLIVVVVSLCNFALLYIVARRIEDNSRVLLQEGGKLEGIEMSGVVAIETLKATSAEDDFFQRWAGNHAKMLNSQRRIHFFNLYLHIVPTILEGLSTLLVLGIGAWQIMNGRLTIGELVAFMSLAASFNQPLESLLGLGDSVQQIRGDITRLDDVLRHPEDPRLLPTNKDKDLLLHPRKLSGDLELRNVTYGYSPMDPPILDDINIKISSGSRVALVGISGSGKTTLARLLSGLNQPWSGEIVFSGYPLSAIPQSSLVCSLALVDQDSMIFEGTINDNLTLWNEAISKIAINNAVHDACFDSVVTQRSGGKENVLLNAGANLSGGQRQQLEIARALAIEPTILILDEATSCLDAKTEKTIFDNLKKRNCTQIIIAHRLSTIRDCDEIIVLDEGKIVERGSHMQLFALDGAYANLVKGE